MDGIDLADKTLLCLTEIGTDHECMPVG